MQKETRLIGLDIETECAVHECTSSDCKHALDPHRSNITVIGVTDGDKLKRVFRGPNKVSEVVKLLESDPTLNFTAHNGKFDVLHLLVKGAPSWLVDRWQHDSSLLAFTDQDKIPASWLAAYDARRVVLNKTRRGNSHRKAGPHSLKTTAPYYLGVEAFWEAESHDNDDYVLKDAEYSLRLTNYFLNKLPARSLDFYSTKYLPWTKNLLQAELTGIRLDVEATEKMLAETQEKLAKLEAEVEQLWKPHFDAYVEMQQDSIRAEYREKLAGALAKSTDVAKTTARYKALEEKALSKVEPLNLGSPVQLAWLLRERLNLNPVGLDGEPSTDKEALELLSEQSADVKKLLEIRKLKKLTQAFLPEYLAVHTNGRIHTTFNVTEARTGRLSSSGVINIQQTPGDLHKLFIADEGKVLITKDLSAIEPTVLAYYSEDPQLCNLMINRGDFHSTNAKFMFNLSCDVAEVKKLYPKYRQVAKTVGLAVLYGAGANQVYRTLLQNGLHQFAPADAKAIVYRIRDLYSGVWKFKTALDSEMEKGATIYNLLGRPIKIQDPQDSYMKSLNTLIQSSASDLLQSSGAEIKQVTGLNFLALIHDELVLQSDESQAKEIEKVMERIMTSFNLETKFGLVPIRVEGQVSKLWAK